MPVKPWPVPVLPLNKRYRSLVNFHSVARLHDHKAHRCVPDDNRNSLRSGNSSYPGVKWGVPAGVPMGVPMYPPAPPAAPRPPAPLSLAMVVSSCVNSIACESLFSSSKRSIVPVPRLANCHMEKTNA